MDFLLNNTENIEGSKYTRRNVSGFLGTFSIKYESFGRKGQNSRLIRLMEVLDMVTVSEVYTIVS